MFCGKLLGWLGADVTLVTPPPASRSPVWAPVAQFGAQSVSLRHLHYNHGKARVEVDLRSEGARHWLRERATDVDIVVEDWGGGDTFGRETGVTYVDLRRWNPRVVYCRISAFGQAGPYAGLPASELTILAASGLLSLTGDPDRSPLRVNEDLACITAGLHGAIGAVLALVNSLRTGAGEEVDVSAQAAVAVTLEAPYGRVLAGAPSSRMGSRHYATSPCNVYRAKDGWVGVCANQDAQIAEIVKAVSRGSFKQSIPPVDDLRRNQALSTAFDAVLADLIARRTVDELMAEGRARGLLLAKVNEIPDLCRDEHVVARGAIRALGGGYPEDWMDIASPIHWQYGHRRGNVGAQVLRNEPRSRPLEGLKVVDFSWAWAGPYCTKMLAAAGAEVIKIENPTRPDVLRRYPPSVGSGVENECSSFFADQNWNKKSVLLDMRSEESIETVRHLLRCADVVVENFRPHVMANWGLRFEDVLMMNPRIVYVSLSGYGATGPYSSRPAYGALMESEGGLASLIGYSADRPYRSGTSLPDPILGAMAAAATGAAIAHSLTTGEGVYIDVGMLEATLAVLGPVVLSWTAVGEIPRAAGNRSWEGAPEGCYRCAGADAWVALSVRDEREWEGLCHLLGMRAWLRDPEFATRRGRVARAEEIEGVIERWSVGRNKSDAAEELRRAGVPAFAVLTLADLLEDKQLNEFGFWPRVNHREMGPVNVLGIPFRMSGRAWPVLSPPPLVGQHTAEVLESVSIAQRP